MAQTELTPDLVFGIFFHASNASFEMSVCQCHVSWCELPSFRTHDVTRSNLHIIYVILVVYFFCFWLFLLASCFCFWACPLANASRDRQSLLTSFG